MSVNLRLKWIAEYHGPNPYANDAVVVGELSGETLPHIGRVRSGCTELWAQSGIDRDVDEDQSLANDDVLLTLGKASAGWAKAALNEVRGFVLHAGAKRLGDRVYIWVGFHHAALSRNAILLALRHLTQHDTEQANPTTFKADLNRFWLSCRRHHPDYQARILMVGAQEMGVPYQQFLPGSNYWQFGWGIRSRVFMESSSNADGLLGSQWQKSKATAKALMKALGLPTPAYVLVRREEDLGVAVEQVGFPCVVKPLDAGGGKGVTANIQTLFDARSAYRFAFSQKQGPVMVEAHLEGDDHRLMVIEGRFVAAIRRQPSFVVGDGRTSVAELVEQVNRHRSTNIVRSQYLRPIMFDNVLSQHLASQSLQLTDVPSEGRHVTLRSNANLSTGGVCTDVTEQCHPQVREMTVLLARTSGLSTFGADYLTTDISKSPTQSGGGFIEMNTTPGLDACVAAGWSETSIARLVLGEAVGRIPVDVTLLSVAGLDRVRAKLEKVRLADDEALVIGDEFYLGVSRFRLESDEPWAAVRASLRNAMVTRLHVICSVNDLEQLGCPVDLVRQVTIAISEEGTGLSPSWVETLRRCSERKVLWVSEHEIQL